MENFNPLGQTKRQALQGRAYRTELTLTSRRPIFCIADLTGTRNENTLLEVGAAYTLNIPVIPVSEGELPSDIRGNLRVTLDAGQIEKEPAQKEFMKALKRRLQEATKEIGLHSTSQFIAFGYETRRNVDSYTLIKGSQRRIDILTTNLGFVVNEELKHGLNLPRMTVLQMLASTLQSKPSGIPQAQEPTRDAPAACFWPSPAALR
ncbi:MAG: hypothetical protein HY238_09110 [Acidobacteria bacterium]|nr:hypothetical protein [Acidobacteriota bacterium]